jgi:protein gp37
MVFVNSMSDLFHKDVPDEFIELVAKVMAIANWHTYQILTKRADRLNHLLKTKLSFASRLANIWWGVSVENRKHGVPRIRHLQDARPKMAFLSIEPLLENIGRISLKGINWVIVGGESGAGARPLQREWVIRIQEQCRNAGVPFFFKQWGGVRKSLNGRELDGKTYDEIPLTAKTVVPSLSERRRLAASIEIPKTIDSSVRTPA